MTLRSIRTLFCVLAVAGGSLAAASPALAGSVEFFDVEARFEPAGGQLPCVVQSTPKLSCAQLTVAIKFKNLGNATSPQNRVSLNQYTGRRAGGYAVRFGGSGALETLPALAPGQEVTLSWSANRVSVGEYTFQPRYASPLNDADNRNHVITHTYQIVTAPGSAPAPTHGVGSGPAAAGSVGGAPGFDVAASFTSASGEFRCQTEVNPIGQPQCVALTVQIKFKNIGGSASPQRKVSLNKFNGGVATGYAQRFGGSGAFQTLPPLAPGEEVTLSWSAGAVPLGRYTFRPVYSGPLNDGNNANHAIVGTFDVVAQ